MTDNRVKMNVTITFSYYADPQFYTDDNDSEELTVEQLADVDRQSLEMGQVSVEDLVSWGDEDDLVVTITPET